MTTWLTFSETRARLGNVSKDTLRARMRETPDHIEKPWVDHGSGGKRAAYRFEEAKIDRWWREVATWRASARSVGSGRSGGETPTGSSEAGSARPSAQPRRSATKSKKPTPSGDDGSFLTLLRAPTGSSQ